jgi:hypothetical protein
MRNCREYEGVFDCPCTSQLTTRRSRMNQNHVRDCGIPAEARWVSPDIGEECPPWMLSSVICSFDFWFAVRAVAACYVQAKFYCEASCGTTTELRVGSIELLAAFIYTRRKAALASICLYSTNSTGARHLGYRMPANFLTAADSPWIRFAS